MTTVVAARVCVIDGCDLPHSARGFCRTHYERFRTLGDPGDSVIRPYGRGSRMMNGYVQVYVGNGRRMQRARFVLAQVLGRPLLSHETVHHINGIRDDDRPENLQLRSSHHGPGAAYECAHCGSRDVRAIEIEGGQ